MRRIIPIAVRVARIDSVAIFDHRIRELTNRETKLLGTMPDEKLAKRLGLGVSAVASKRRALGIAAFGERTAFVWDWASRALLGRLPDTAVARKLGIKLCAVHAKLDGQRNA